MMRPAILDVPGRNAGPLASMFVPAPDTTMLPTPSVGGITFL
jgi:hypothetical protein